MVYSARSFLADPLLPTLEVEERFGAKQHRMTRLHQPSPPPWRLLGFSALIGLAIPYCTSQMAFLEIRFSGRAAVFDSTNDERPGWQLVIDERAAAAGGMGELLEFFEKQVAAGGEKGRPTGEGSAAEADLDAGTRPAIFGRSGDSGIVG